MNLKENYVSLAVKELAFLRLNAAGMLRRLATETVHVPNAFSALYITNPYTFDYIAFVSMYVLSRNVARISALRAHKLQQCRCVRAASSTNGNHAQSHNGNGNREIRGVTWGLAYNERGVYGDGNADSYQNLDAIVVLGGGQTGPDSLPPWVERRLDTALSLQRLQRSPCPILSLGGGTPHKGPYLDPRGFVVHEATACAQYLLARGADPDLLLKEVSSYDTVGNAYFSLTIHAIPAGWRRLAVVTSDFHMPRSAALFDVMYGMAARELYGEPNRFDLLYVASTDEGIFDRDVLETRRAKEDVSRAAWLRTSSALTSLRELHAWLHATHLCYAVNRQHEFGVATVRDPKLLASY